MVPVFVSLTRESNHEAYFSAEPSPQAADTRVSRPNEHEERPTGPQAASRQGPQAPHGVVVVAAPPRADRPAAAPGGGPGPSRRFRPADRIHKRREFQRVYDRGAKVQGRYMTLFCLPSEFDHSRLGIAATRKIGKAVQRNLAKRRLREIFRTHRPAGRLDIVIVPRREFFEATHAGVEAEYRSLLHRHRRGQGRESTRTR